MRIIAGLYKGRNLKTLPSLDTRPTKDMVKGAIFSMIQFEITNSSVLDLFAGSGSIGIEAISRGAKFVAFNDSNRQAIKVVKENLEQLKIETESYLTLNLDYLLALQQLANDNHKFDFVYIDPPYKMKIIGSLIKKLLSLNLLNNKAVIMAEVDRKDKEFIHPQFNLKVKNYGNTKLLVYRLNPVLVE